ncbi:hypothetical protein D3C76_545780 [compost metagenome]
MHLIEKKSHLGPSILLSNATGNSIFLDESYLEVVDLMINSSKRFSDKTLISSISLSSLSSKLKTQPNTLLIFQYFPSCGKKLYGLYWN